MIPVALALTGTLLMALVIFMPARPPVPEISPLPAAFVTSWMETPSEVEWPTLVDPAAAGSDPHARVALVQALVEVAEPWALAILDRAAREDPDPAVQAALAARGRAYSPDLADVAMIEA